MEFLEEAFTWELEFESLDAEDEEEEVEELEEGGETSSEGRSLSPTTATRTEMSSCLPPT